MTSKREENSMADEQEQQAGASADEKAGSGIDLGSTAKAAAIGAAAGAAAGAAFEAGREKLRARGDEGDEAEDDAENGA